MRLPPGYRPRGTYPTGRETARGARPPRLRQSRGAPPLPMAHAMELAKGSIILAARQSLEVTLSTVEFQRLLAQMPAPARELIDSAALVPSGRYPMERVDEMLGALGQHWG